jgi:hypothetical protein
LLLGLQTTFREKLEWLEEAETLTLQLRAQRESRLAATGTVNRAIPVVSSADAH